MLRYSVGRTIPAASAPATASTTAATTTGYRRRMAARRCSDLSVIATARNRRDQQPWQLRPRGVRVRDRYCRIELHRNLLSGPEAAPSALTTIANDAYDTQIVRSGWVSSDPRSRASSPNQLAARRIALRLGVCSAAQSRPVLQRCEGRRWRLLKTHHD